jgi:hypothetical protein
MGIEHGGQKRQLHIVLLLDNPRQRKTWEILSQQKNKTSAVCEAVCGFHRQKSLEDTLRKLLREELKNVEIPQTAEAVEEPDTTVTPLSWISFWQYKTKNSFERPDV